MTSSHEMVCVTDGALLSGVSDTKVTGLVGKIAFRVDACTFALIRLKCVSPQCAAGNFNIFHHGVRDAGP